MAHDNHNTHADSMTHEQEKAIAKEMFPFLFYAIIPVSIIAIIAFVYGPTY